MDICPKCNSMLRIGKTFYSTENDGTPETETKIFVNMPMLCVNKVVQVSDKGEKASCEFFAGEDLSNPIYVVTTHKHQVN